MTALGIAGAFPIAAPAVSCLDCSVGWLGPDGLQVAGQPPGLAHGSAVRAFVWHDGNGWHVRTTTTADARHLFGGLITLAGGRFTSLSLYKPEADDSISQLSDNQAGFSFLTVGGIDGLDFMTNGASITFYLTLDGETQAPSSIALGPSGASAPTNAFTVSRGDPPTFVRADRQPDHNGWFNHPFTVSWRSLSGYTTTCTAPITYSGPTTVGGGLPGSCTNLADSSSQAATFAPFNYDATAPRVRSTVDTAVSGTGWYRTPVTIRISGHDDNAVGQVEYSVDAGPIVVTSGSSTSLLLTSDGRHSITAQAVDVAGNAASQIRDVWIDSTPPSVSLSGLDTSYSVEQSISLSCTASDALSGVADGICSLATYLNAAGAGSPVAACAPVSADTCTLTLPAYQLGGGMRTLTMVAHDHARNVGSQARGLSIDASAAAQCRLLHNFLAAPSVEAPLCADLQAAEQATAHGQRVLAVAMLERYRAGVATLGSQLSIQQRGTLLLLARSLAPTGLI